MSVQIIVDSTVDMPERMKDRFRIVPLTVHFGAEEFIDGVTIDKHRFYERLVESDELPTTSQASPAAFDAIFSDVASVGDSAVVVTLASKFSGTYQSACIAAAEYDNIYVVDSKSAAIARASLPSTRSSARTRAWTRRPSPKRWRKSATKFASSRCSTRSNTSKRAGASRRLSPLRADFSTSSRSSPSSTARFRLSARREVEAGQQPARAENPRERRHRLRRANYPRLQRPERFVPQKICRGQPRHLAGQGGLARLHAHLQRDRHAHWPRRGGGRILQKGLSL